MSVAREVLHSYGMNSITVSRIPITDVPDTNTCSILTVYFRQTQESVDYIDSTLPNAYVYDFEKSQSVAFPSAHPFAKLFSFESAKSTRFCAYFRQVTTRAVLLAVYCQSQTDHRS